MIKQGKIKNVLIIVILFSLIFMFALLYFLKNSAKDKLETVKLQYSKKYSTDNPDVVDYFKSFIKDQNIVMHEFTDEKSNLDTLIYYYFTLEKDNTNFASIAETIMNDISINIDDSNYLQSNLSNIVDIIYLYSNIALKYDIHNDKINNTIQKIYIPINEYINSFTQKDIGLYVLKWKLCYCCAILNMDMSPFENWQEYKVNITNQDILSEYTKEIVDVLFEKIIENKKNDINGLCKKYSDLYISNVIDIDTYVIYISLLSDLFALDNELIYSTEIFNFYKENFYSSSPFLLFWAFRMVEYCNKSYNYRIKELYSGTPLSDDGFASTAALIIPTFRRLYAYLEICRFLGINISDCNVKNWIDKIDKNAIMIDDLYYARLIFNEYPDFEYSLDNTIDNMMKKLDHVSVTETNSYQFYSFLKALYYFDKNGKKLYNKYKSYINSKGDDINIIEKLWSMELDYLYKGKKPDFSDIESSILNADDEIKTDIYYNYVNLLHINPNDLDELVNEKILAEIQKYRTNGGYYNNPVFKYVDIYKTYQIMHVMNFIQINLY